MVSQDTLVKTAYYIAFIGIIGDVISTYFNLITHDYLEEQGSLIIFFIRYFDLRFGILIGILFNLLLTFSFYLLYKKREYAGLLTWDLSFLRIYVVINNILLFFQLPNLPSRRIDWLIILLGLTLVFVYLRDKDQVN